jgi:hypothetical protein
MAVKYEDQLVWPGAYIAILRDNTSGSNRTKLISPPLDLTSVPDPHLVFTHIQPSYYGAQDELRVYYKTSANAAWNLLATYTNNIGHWEEEKISLPNPSNDYYIAFEGDAKGGRGICLDEVSIEDIVTLPLHRLRIF